MEESRRVVCRRASGNARQFRLLCLAQFCLLLLLLSSIILLPPLWSRLSSPLLSPSSSNYFSLSPLLKGTLFGERLKAAARSPARPAEAPLLVLQQNMMPASATLGLGLQRQSGEGSVSIICRSIWYSLPGLFA